MVELSLSLTHSVSDAHPPLPSLSGTLTHTHSLSPSLTHSHAQVRVDYFEHKPGAMIMVGYAGADTGNSMQLIGEFPGTVDPS